MSDWLARQASFAKAVIDPACAVPSFLRSQCVADLERSFNVYRNNRVTSLVEALKSTYPAVLILVGEEFFTFAARAFISLLPPRSPVLLTYGAEFGDFLEAFEPASRLPYLPDIARFEWLRVAAYHARDAAPLSIDLLADLPAGILPSLRFQLHPSLALFSSAFPVASLWAATVGGEKNRKVEMRRGECAVVLRPGLAVEQRLLRQDSFIFLSRLSRGGSLAQACQAALGANDGFDISKQLQGLFEMGAVTRISQSQHGQDER
jgi:hypothetical protein